MPSEGQSDEQDLRVAAEVPPFYDAFSCAEGGSVAVP